MYIFSEMIDLGLKKGQQWPSKAHRKVAQTLALENPEVTNRDRLTRIVQAIIGIPQDRIKVVTLTECREEFGVPV